MHDVTILGTVNFLLNIQEYLMLKILKYSENTNNDTNILISIFRLIVVTILCKIGNIVTFIVSKIFDLFFNKVSMDGKIMIMERMSSFIATVDELEAITKENESK